MNIIVVDDEPIIRVGLRTLVDWERHGFRLAGEAADGFEALDLMASEPVDILITDILMPGMDGLELIRKARESHHDVAVLVLSCLDDFAYVKEAMKLGASDYILKPTMETEELVAILQGMREKLEQERAARDQLGRWQQQIEQTKQMRLSERIRRYIHQQTAADGELEAELFAQTGAVVSLMVYWAPKDELLPAALPFADCAAAVTWQEQALLLYYPCDASAMQSKLFAHQWCYHHATAVNRLLRDLAGQEMAPDTRWFVGIGPVIRQLSDLPASLQLHQRQIRHVYYAAAPGTAPGTIVGQDGLAGVSDDPVFPYELRNDLLRAIATANGEALLHRTEGIAAWICEAKPDITKLHGFTFELLALALGYAREQNYAALDEFERLYVSKPAIADCFDAHGLTHWLSAAMRELWSRRFGGVIHATSSNPFVRKAIQFMRDNYRRNIGTVDIADHVKLSRSYLSDLYSRETGESLVESLTSIRIEEAKKLLMSGDAKKVYEIAESVGFSDAKAFARTFRKLVGCSPKEYVLQR